MSSNSGITWPRPYLLEIHERAVDEGCCRVEGIGPQQARSLIASFYRIRRRGDTKHKLGFIKPEYHLVMATYEPERQSVLFTYNAMPDNVELPEIVSVPPEERLKVAQAALVQSPTPSAAATLPTDIDAEIEKLVTEAAKQDASQTKL